MRETLGVLPLLADGNGHIWSWREDSTRSTAQPRKAPYIGIVAVSGHRVVLENIGVRKHTSYLVAVLELPLLKKPNI